MPKLIKDGELASNAWKFLSDSADCTEETLATHACIVPLADYKSQNRDGKNITFWVEGDEDASTFSDVLVGTDMVAIYFPVFTDGRGFSLARTLREQYEYQGDIRAIGNFIQDQMYYLSRCGFTSFEIPDTFSVESVKNSLSVFSEQYQAGVDEPQPLFRRRS
jgi:Uncharacterized protein conserved in bacteria